MSAKKMGPSSMGVHHKIESKVQTQLAICFDIAHMCWLSFSHYSLQMQVSILLSVGQRKSRLPRKHIWWCRIVPTSMSYLAKWNPSSDFFACTRKRPECYPQESVGVVNIANPEAVNLMRVLATPRKTWYFLFALSLRTIASRNKPFDYKLSL